MRLAIILAVCAVFTPPAFAGVVYAAFQQTEPAPADKTQTNTAEPESRPQAPSNPSQPCEQSKDTCELTPEPQQAPATAPGPTATQPETQTKIAEPAATPKKSSPHAARKKSQRKKKGSITASGPRKVIIRDGGTTEPNNQLSPGTAGQQAAAGRHTTDQLLATAQANLKMVSGRTLTPSQQATVEQIKMFVEQANSALKEGDLQRGHNLAMKAQLLSDDLVKH